MPIFDEERWEVLPDGSRRRRRPHLLMAEEVAASEATKAAVDLANQLGVDLAQIAGTGAGGRITKADVESAAQ